MTDLAARPRLIEESYLKLAPPFLGKPVIACILVAFLLKVRDLDQAAVDVWGLWDVDNATGEALAILGRIVGEPRYNRNDDAFRIAIKGRIAANRSRATLPDILRVASLMFGAVKIREGRACFEISADLSAFDSMQIEAAWRTLRTAKAAGVNCQLTGGVSGNVLTFGHAGAPSDPEQGLGSTTDASVGGLAQNVARSG